MKLFSSFVNIFYPNHCLHCYRKVKKKYFCENCINFFSLIYPKKNQFNFAVFEKEGPIITLLNEIIKKQIYGLIKLAASFIVVQHSKLNWQIPDIIVPVSKNRIFKDHIFYLSKEVALLFDKPICFKNSTDKLALFIDDIFNIENIEKIENGSGIKKSLYISLCSSDEFQFME